MILRNDLDRSCYYLPSSNQCFRSPNSENRRLRTKVFGGFREPVRPSLSARGIWQVIEPKASSDDRWLSRQVEYPMKRIALSVLAVLAVAAAVTWMMRSQPA